MLGSFFGDCGGPRHTRVDLGADAQTGDTECLDNGAGGFATGDDQLSNAQGNEALGDGGQGIFDEAAEWVVSPRTLASQGNNTPFLDHPMQGRVRYTLVEGQVMYEG